MLKYLLILVVSAVTSPAQTPAFEVASIRSAAQITPQMIQAGKLHVGMNIDAARVDIGYMSLRDLIPLAFDVKPFQVTGPDWMVQQRFDIVATLPEGATKEQVPAMLRALLEERFKLKAHRENREQNVYALEVAKNGPKLKEAPAESEKPPADAKGGLVIGAGDQQLRIKQAPGGQGMTMFGGKNGNMRVSMGPGGQMHMEMERVTMADFAQMLTPMLDRPVVDRTELKGAFQIALDLSMQDMMQTARKAGALPAGIALPPGAGGPDGLTASDPSGGAIFSSVQQLGLRLEKQKAPVETVVVDSVEKNPTEN